MILVIQEAYLRYFDEYECYKKAEMKKPRRECYIPQRYTSDHLKMRLNVYLAACAADSMSSYKTAPKFDPCHGDEFSKLEACLDDPPLQATVLRHWMGTVKRSIPFDVYLKLCSEKCYSPLGHKPTARKLTASNVTRRHTRTGNQYGINSDSPIFYGDIYLLKYLLSPDECV